MSLEKFRAKLNLRTTMNMVKSQAITLKNNRAEQLVDKSTGQLGYKQDVKFTSTKKYEDKELGFTAEYQTQGNSKRDSLSMKDNFVKTCSFEQHHIACN
ncbi:hypothetical protein ACFX12_019038 [Malus domestica]